MLQLLEQQLLAVIKKDNLADVKTPFETSGVHEAGGRQGILEGQRLRTTFLQDGEAPQLVDSQLITLRYACTGSAGFDDSPGLTKTITVANPAVLRSALFRCRALRRLS